MSIADKLVAIAENEQKVYNTGFEAGYEALLRDFVTRCNAQFNFLYAFAGVGWNSKTYCPTPDMVFKCDTNSSSMYAYASNITKTIAAIDISRASANAKGTFENSRLETITKLIVSETTPELRFTGCYKLKNITIVGTIGTGYNFSGAPNLTLESLKHIISVLKDYSGTDKEFKNTLTLSSNSKAILEAEGATAPNGDTWLNYAFSKGWNV